MRIIFEATLGYISIMKHMSISKWLSQLGLPQYCTLFDEEYDGVEVKSAHTVSLDTHTCMPFTAFKLACNYSNSHLKFLDCL